MTLTPTLGCNDFIPKVPYVDRRQWCPPLAPLPSRPLALLAFLPCYPLTLFPLFQNPDHTPNTCLARSTIRAISSLSLACSPPNTIFVTIHPTSHPNMVTDNGSILNLGLTLRVKTLSGRRFASCGGLTTPHLATMTSCFKLPKHQRRSERVTNSVSDGVRWCQMISAGDEWVRVSG